MIKLYFLIGLVCFFCTACSNEPPQEVHSASIPEIGFDIYSSHFLNVDVEKDYDNFSVECDNKNYSADTESIVFGLKNNNPGNGFYLYDIPIVEKKNLESWESVKYNPPSYYERWSFCGNENDPNSCFIADIWLHTEFLDVSDLIGTYRVGLITPKSIHYFEFSIEQGG